MDTLGIEFIVGEEKKLQEILSGQEVMPLLEGTVNVGAIAAALKDRDGHVLWHCGDASPPESMETHEQPLFLEGEPVGQVVVLGERGREHVKDLAILLHIAIKTLLVNNLKRLLTTEIHTSVVHLSHEELLQSYQKLATSESLYRDLAENLDRKVKERTEELQRAYVVLLQQEKMASVGQLAAGMAHEINNPMGFITSNLRSLKKYTERFQEMLEMYRSAVSDPGGVSIETGGQLQQEWENRKLDLILADIGELFEQSEDGCKRITKIVADLKGFSHIDKVQQQVGADINHEIDRTLAVLVYEIPVSADIIKKYGSLPSFTCNPGQLCQVFFNIVKNAIQARPDGLQLQIETGFRDGMISVGFTDNGAGIKKDDIRRVFDPFFTTREVGQGTGMGLTAAYDIISSYDGKITVNSQPGKGTTFLITLPCPEGAQ